MTAELDALPTPALEQLERQLIAFLYAIWRAQGKSKRVVEIRPDKKDGIRPFDTTS